MRAGKLTLMKTTTTEAKTMTAAQRNCILKAAGLPYTGSKGNATTLHICIDAGWLVRAEGPGTLGKYGYVNCEKLIVPSLEGERLAGI